MMPPVPKAAVAKYWETCEDLIKDRCVRIDEDSGEGPVLHDGLHSIHCHKVPGVIGAHDAATHAAQPQEA